jgi:hypothetical protein
MSKYPKVVMVAIEPYLTMNSLSNKWDEFHWNCINTKSTINIKNNIKDFRAKCLSDNNNITHNVNASDKINKLWL